MSEKRTERDRGAEEKQQLRADQHRPGRMNCSHVVVFRVCIVVWESGDDVACRVLPDMTG